MKIRAIKDNNKTLSEALGQPYPYKWTAKTNRRYEAAYDKLWIGFFDSAFRDSGNWEIAFDVGGVEGITGDGDAFKILSTVVAATREWWSEQDAAKIRTIVFSADKYSGEGNGRTALYRRFATQFAKDIGFVVRIGTDRTSQHTTNYVLTNPNFQPKVNEDGKIVKGVNTTADVKPGETQRQAAKFGNKLNSKGEPPLLNAKARKNSSPHVLANLGLAEAAQDVTAFGVDATTSETDDMIVLDQVKARDRGTGAGTKYMQELTQYADIVGKPITLTPSNSLGGSVARLKKFYKRFGFVEHKSKNYAMIRYPQTKKVTEDMQVDTYGYKAMNYNPETGEITSGADSRVTKGIKLRKGMTLTMPGKGIFMSTNRKYIEDYYSGHNDHEALIKFKFDPATITSGNLSDRENEFTVPSATVVGFKVIDNLNESHQLNELFEQPYNWKWKIAPEPMDATSRADFRTHDNELVNVGFDSHDGVHTVDFDKNFSFGATNQGDQFRIFATVMDVIRDYVKKVDPKTISFSAEKDPRGSRPMSRINLYKRMVAKFAQQINMSFEFIDADQDTIFKLTNNNMNEEIKKPRPEDTLGVSRADMPQIHASHYPELFNYLKQNGATFSKGSVAATELKAVQSEFSDDGVEKMMRKGGITADGTKKPLIVSADNYIIDGHHRWLAAYNLEEEVPIIKFSLPVKELLQLVNDFKHTTYRGIYKEKEVQNEKTINNRGHNRH
jgi:GNAT superfamily N-acetyltransferase